MKHARYYWLLLAEGHLNRRQFGAMLGRIALLPTPTHNRWWSSPRIGIGLASWSKERCCKSAVEYGAICAVLTQMADRWERSR